MLRRSLIPYIGKHVKSGNEYFFLRETFNNDGNHTYQQNTGPYEYSELIERIVEDICIEECEISLNFPAEKIFEFSNEAVGVHKLKIFNVQKIEDEKKFWDDIMLKITEGKGVKLV